MDGSCASFKQNRIVYIENFITDEARESLLGAIMRNEAVCKKRNQDTPLNKLGQLNVRQNSEKIGKQHSIITGSDIQAHLPSLHYYYHNCLADTVSQIVGVKVYPVNERGTINNCVIIYENEGDSIRWHTDGGMFNGKKVFTLLIYLLNSSSQNLCYITHDNSETCIFTREKSCVILEQFTLEHAVTPLRPNEKKIMWSMTFAEDMNITSPIGYMMDKIKQINYVGIAAINRTDAIICVLMLLLIIISVYAVRKCKRQK